MKEEYQEGTVPEPLLLGTRRFLPGVIAVTEISEGVQVDSKFVR